MESRRAKFNYIVVCGDMRSYVSARRCSAEPSVAPTLPFSFRLNDTTRCNWTVFIISSGLQWWAVPWLFNNALLLFRPIRCEVNQSGCCATCRFFYAISFLLRGFVSFIHLYNSCRLQAFVLVYLRFIFLYFIHIVWVQLILLGKIRRTLLSLLVWMWFRYFPNNTLCV